MPWFMAKSAGAMHVAARLTQPARRNLKTRSQRGKRSAATGPEIGALSTTAALGPLPHPAQDQAQ